MGTPTAYYVTWPKTKDKDTCYGLLDLQDLLKEAGCVLGDDGNLRDKETNEIVGYVSKEEK